MYGGNPPPPGALIYLRENIKTRPFSFSSAPRGHRNTSARIGGGGVRLRESQADYFTVLLYTTTTTIVVRRPSKAAKADYHSSSTGTGNNLLPTSCRPGPSCGRWTPATRSSPLDPPPGREKNMKTKVKRTKQNKTKQRQERTNKSIRCRLYII